MAHVCPSSDLPNESLFCQGSRGTLCRRANFNFSPQAVCDRQAETNSLHLSTSTHKPAIDSTQHRRDSQTCSITASRTLSQRRAAFRPSGTSSTPPSSAYNPFWPNSRTGREFRGRQREVLRRLVVVCPSRVLECEEVLLSHHHYPRVQLCCR